jgi:hypothetical protein
VARRAEKLARRCPKHLKGTAELVIWEARQAHQRLSDGLDHVADDDEALRCFRFMNRVMRDQRIASQVAAATGLGLLGHDRAGARRGRAAKGPPPRRGGRSSWRSS